MISRFTEKFSRTGRAVIAAFGDSVTEGYFESREGMHGIKDGEAVYTNVLGRMISAAFPDRRIDVVNAGKGGDTAYLALSRLYSDVVSRSRISLLCASDLTMLPAVYKNILTPCHGFLWV